MLPPVYRALGLSLVVGAVLTGLMGARTATAFCFVCVCRAYVSVLLAVIALLWVRRPYLCFAVIDLAAL